MKLTEHEYLEICRLMQWPEDLDDWDRKNGENLNWYRSGAAYEDTKLGGPDGLIFKNSKFALYEKMNAELWERLSKKNN